MVKKEHPTTLMILIIIVALLIWLAFNYAPILFYRSSPETVADAFWTSMRKRDSSLMARVVTKESFAVADTWITTHSKIQNNCADFLVEGPTRSVRTVNETISQISIYFNCSTLSGKQYCFAIYDIIADKSRFGWLVSDWGLINEGQNMEECRVNRR